MATTDSPLNIKGSIKGLRFYNRKDCPHTIVGEKGGANIDLIRNNKAFEGLRKAENEFRGRSKCAKDIRRALGIWSHTVVNSFLQAKLAGLLMKVVKIDDILKKGKRAIYLSKYKEILNQINYYSYKPLNEILFCNYSVETSEDRMSVKVTLKGLNPKMHVKAPKMASHFQLCLSIGTVTDYEVASDSNIYIGPIGANANRGSQYISEWIPIDGEIMDEVSLKVSLPDYFTIKDNHTVIRAFGIVFGKMMRTVEELGRETGSIVLLETV